MPIDLIGYDILAQEALRGLGRTVAGDAGEDGLPGDIILRHLDTRGRAGGCASLIDNTRKNDDRVDHRSGIKGGPQNF